MCMYFGVHTITSLPDRPLIFYILFSPISHPLCLFESDRLEIQSFILISVSCVRKWRCTLNNKTIDNDIESSWVKLIENESETLEWIILLVCSAVHIIYIINSIQCIGIHDTDIYIRTLYLKFVSLSDFQFHVLIINAVSLK